MKPLPKTAHVFLIYTCLCSNILFYTPGRPVLPFYLPKGGIHVILFSPYLFSCMQSISWGWRQFAVILMGIYLPSVAVLLVVMTDQIKKYINPGRWVTGIAGILFVLAGFQIFYGWARYDIGFIRASRAESKVLVLIEQTLLSHGMKSPSEVFADRYDFYTPNTMPYRSRQIGNWSGDWVWGFSDEFTPLPNDSWEVFARACKEQGIRFLALSPNSFYRGEIFPPIYYGEVGTGCAWAAAYRPKEATSGSISFDKYKATLLRRCFYFIIYLTVGLYVWAFTMPF